MEIGDICIYIYIIRETSLLWPGHYIMWAELSVNYFYDIVTIGNGH